MPDTELTSTTNLHAAQGSSSSADVRPILPRSAENTWQKCESIRTALYGHLETLCRERHIEALTLQSNPYTTPVWVKLESWHPVQGSTLTARASMTVTITPMPYHRFETTYAFAWEKHGRSGVISQLYRFGSAELAKIFDFLREDPATEMTHWRARSILKSSQMRTSPLQFWRPNNKVVSLRRDYFKIGAWTATLVGAAMLFSPQDVRRGLESVSSEPSMPDPVSAPSSPPAPVAPSPAHASPPPNATNSAPPTNITTGTLGVSDGRLPDGRYYDECTYQKAPGERVRIVMRSTAIDSYLIAGTVSNGVFRELMSNDDERQGTLDAALVFPAEMNGEIVIRATSAQPGERGA